MMSTLNNHLEGAIEKLAAVLNDSLDLHGTGHKNIVMAFLRPFRVKIEKDARYFMASMENRRAILKKLMNEYITRILLPSVI